MLTMYQALLLYIFISLTIFYMSYGHHEVDIIYLLLLMRKLRVHDINNASHFLSSY